MRRCLVFFIFILLIFPLQAQAEVVRGIFGLPSIGNFQATECLSQLRQAGINAVFVPADKKTIKWFKVHGLRVYVSVNVFGGKEAWKRYPDSRPIKADGNLLGSEPDYKGHGGVCPTHKPWRHERLKYIEKLVKDYGGVEGIDGIWLDFIRYPGLWEVKEPEIPDTCYCSRCLKKFRQDTDIDLPVGLRPYDAALWIRKNCFYEWMMWKKEQILYFVTEASKIIHGISNKKPLKLGLFLVPWTKGKRQNAISYRLAQDAFQLSEVGDVISPMLYHKMCGQTESWVGYMTRYYKETAHCQVLPILQSIDSGPEEFARVLKYAGQAGADGILVFSFKGVKPDLWGSFKGFQEPANLITNPEFRVPQGDELPAGWHAGKSEDGNIKKSVFLVKSSDKFNLKETRDISQGKGSQRIILKSGFTGRNTVNCLGITSGHDQSGVWFSSLPDCTPGIEYVFNCRLFREKWENGIYPTISLWGKEFYVNNHWLNRTFQPIRLYVTCPEGPHDNDFRFINHNPERTFWLTKPNLSINYSLKDSSTSSLDPPFFYNNFFPIGVFGANLENLEQIKKLSLNTVLIGGCDEELKRKVRKCHQLGLRYILSVPRDPDRLHVFLNDITEYVHPSNLAFYVNDEPGIHSFPINMANDINLMIKERFPGAATCMAVVRPQVCRDYLEASDFFMMDQYPVPFMPMTWLSDSMDQARNDVGIDRLASVIQAFGGRKWADLGWPRMPTWQEMDCLAFLSIVHGSQGIFFYTFNEIGKSKERAKRLGRVVARLNLLYPWLLEKNIDQIVNVEMLSPYRVDPKGRPAIHCCLKKKEEELLLIAVNTIGTYVETIIRFRDLGIAPYEIERSAFNWAGEFREVFSGVYYPVGKQGLRVKFKPYETKAFLFIR